MKAITIAERCELETKAKNALIKRFNTGKRERFRIIVSPVNGNVPSLSFSFNSHEPIDLKFGFSITIEPKYQKHFKEGEKEEIYNIVKDITGTTGHLFTRFYRYLFCSHFCLDFMTVREPEPDEELYINIEHIASR